MRGLHAPLTLVAARARRRPQRWLLPALGIALAAGFAGAVAATGAITGDQAARSVLDRLPPLVRTVRVTSQGTAIASVPPSARRRLGDLDLGAPTRVLLLRPVRLEGYVVRPAAISPLDRWIAPAVASGVGRCRPGRCPMIAAGEGRLPRTLTTPGARIKVVGGAPLRSAVPLGFPARSSREGPILLSGDVRGLDDLEGLGGAYRTGTWLAPLPLRRLHSWQLAAVESRLRRAQADVAVAGSQLSLTAPFAGLDRARAMASAAPRRLLLVGGGAAAALGLFCLLAAGGLRRDQRAELARLEAAGATAGQSVVFVAGEAAFVSGVALIAGAALAIGVGAVLASAAGEPVGAVLAHSVATPLAALVLACAWLATATAMTAFTLSGGSRVADALAFAATCALVTALAIESPDTGSVALLVVPLACLAAAVLLARLAVLLLRTGERVARRGPLVVRLALINLARSPAFPSLAIAFVAVTVGLGGFALAYRATLARGAADQAADRVPLDAIVAPGSDFATPLERAPLRRWRRIAGGNAFPVRRTEANYAGGVGTVTVPALGVPAAALAAIHGWRAGDASAPLGDLARRLRSGGPVRARGPEVPAAAQSLAVRVSSPAVNVSLTVDLRDPAGSIRRLGLGTARGSTLLRARLPRRRREVEAVELSEPTGLEITNGHQNGENPAAATQSAAPVTLGPLTWLRDGRRSGQASVGRWRAVGAASAARGERRGEALRFRFATTGAPGVVRPVQPGDSRALPLLADPRTAAAVGPGGRLGLTIDGQPVRGRVVGVLRRFPTLAARSAGFVVADQATLSSALDAQLPGQGRPDELWISTRDPARLEAALERGPLSGFRAAFRSEIADRLLNAPLARGILGSLIAAVALAGGLALVGLLAGLWGAARDERVERDLEAQGVGPRGLRAELRTRLLITSALGVGAGVAVAALLVRLAVDAVRAAGAAAVPRPPLVTVLPWGELAAGAAAVIAALGAVAWLATALVVGREAKRPAERPPADERAGIRPAGAVR
jgi:hypothetical protein